RFLTKDLLSRAEPAFSAAEDHVTLLDILDRAAENVGGRFAGQPDVEESLRRTIAETYHGLASWDKAERQWRAVVEGGRRGAAARARRRPIAQGPRPVGAHPLASRPARRRGARDGPDGVRGPGAGPRARPCRHPRQPEQPRRGLRQGGSDRRGHRAVR